MQLENHIYDLSTAIDNQRVDLLDQCRYLIRQFNANYTIKNPAVKLYQEMLIEDMMGSFNPAGLIDFYENNTHMLDVGVTVQSKKDVDIPVWSYDGECYNLYIELDGNNTITEIKLYTTDDM